MNQNIEAITGAVSLIFKAAIVVAKYSGRVRKRSLKRLATMNVDEKDIVSLPYCCHWGNGLMTDH